MTQQSPTESRAKGFPRARLDTTYWVLLRSSVEITLGFLLASLLSYIISQPRLPTRTPTTSKKGAELEGKNVVVSGSNVGIGYEIAKEHFLRGAHVTLACRNESRAKDAKVRLIKETGWSSDEDRLEIMLLDCSSLERVRKFAETWKSSNRKIDYLFLNAGIADKPQNASRFTQEGFELV
jgi:hypothetical protein